MVFSPALAEAGYELYLQELINFSGKYLRFMQNPWKHKFRVLEISVKTDQTKELVFKNQPSL